MQFNYLSVVVGYKIIVVAFGIINYFLQYKFSSNISDVVHFINPQKKFIKNTLKVHISLKFKCSEMAAKICRNVSISFDGTYTT